jgi:hypothetical protein
MDTNLSQFFAPEFRNWKSSARNAEKRVLLWGGSVEFLPLPREALGDVSFYDLREFHSQCAFPLSYVDGDFILRQCPQLLDSYADKMIFLLGAVLTDGTFKGYPYLVKRPGGWIITVMSELFKVRIDRIVIAQAKNP